MQNFFNQTGYTGPRAGRSVKDYFSGLLTYTNTVQYYTPTQTRQYYDINGASVLINEALQAIRPAASFHATPGRRVPLPPFNRRGVPASRDTERHSP